MTPYGWANGGSVDVFLGAGKYGRETEDLTLLFLYFGVL